MTVLGKRLLCLKYEHNVDLKAGIREQLEPVRQIIRDATRINPERHYFILAQKVKIPRFMNTTGG